MDIATCPRSQYLVAFTLVLSVTGCSGLADTDLCESMCDRLEQCTLCLYDNVAKRCRTNQECRERCKTNATTNTAAACIANVSGCDKAGFNTCLSGGGTKTDGGTPPTVGKWTFKGQGTYKESQTYKGVSGSACAVKVDMTGTVNVKAPGWVQVGFQIQAFNHNVDLTGPAGAPPKVTCVTGSTLEGKTFYDASFDKTRATFTLMESNFEGSWVMGTISSSLLKGQGSKTFKEGIDGTKTKILEFELKRAQ